MNLPFTLRAARCLKSFLSGYPINSIPPGAIRRVFAFGDEMAARTVKIRHDDQTRAKIKTSQLINRLSDHVLGTVDLKPTQVAAALGLLRKTIPDLSSAENKTEVVHRYVARLPEKAKSTETWQQQHAPRTTIQ